MKKKLNKMIEVLESNPHGGDFVERSLWPNPYKSVHLSNLYRYDIDSVRRLAYTLRPLNEETFDVAIIEFFPSHKEYSKRFGYKL